MTTRTRAFAVKAALITTLPALLLAAGCSSSTSSEAHTTEPHTSAPHTSAPSSPSTSATHGKADLTGLLIGPGDIGPGVTVSQPPATSTAGPADVVTGAFSSADGTRIVGDTIVVFPTASDATAGLNLTLSQVQQRVAGATVQSVDVGTNGHLYTGHDAQDSHKAMSILVFGHGRAVVTLGFASAADDGIPPALAQAVAKAQDMKLTTLPN